MKFQQSYANSGQRVEKKAPGLVRLFLYAIVFFMPLESISFGPLTGQATPTRIIGYFLLPIALFTANTCFRRVPKAMWCFSIYISLYWIAGILVPGGLWDRVFALGFTFTQLVVLFWILTNILDEDQARQGVIYAFVLGCLGLVLCQMLHLPGVGGQLYVSKQLSAGRDTALGEDPNITAQYYCLGALCCIGILLGKWKLWQKLSVVPIIPLLIVHMLLLGSRGSVLALIVSSGVFILTGRTVAQRATVMLVFLALLFAVLFLSSTNSTLVNRWALALQGNFAKREILYPSEFAMIEERPVFGWGPNMNEIELGHRMGAQRFNTHNVFLWVLTELGLVGLIPFLIGTYLCIRGGWKARFSSAGYLPFALMFALIFSNMTITTHHLKIYWLTMAYALAAGLAAARPIATMADSSKRSVESDPIWES